MSKSKYEFKKSSENHESQVWKVDPLFSETVEEEFYPSFGF